MALIDKVVSTLRKIDFHYLEPRNRSRCCEIALQQVRLLLYKECDIKGRKVLFDSSTIDRLPAEKNDKPNFNHTNKFPCILEVSNGHKYIYKGQAADASLLGEMMFGAVAMSYKSVSFKIHITNDPRRLMCTKIFTVPLRRASRLGRKEANSSGEFDRSRPLSVPHVREEGVSLSFSLDRGDSGFCGEHSSYSSAGSTGDYYSMLDMWDGLQRDSYCFHTPPGRSLSVCSAGSWQRRTFHSAGSRFELGRGSLQVPLSSCDSQVYSNSSASGTSDSLASSASGAARGNRLGLALLITVADNDSTETVRRCVELSPQLQALVCRLRVATLAAGTSGSFVSTLHQASEDAARWLSELVSGPRLQPLWLSLATSEPRAAGKMADGLLADLCAVLALGDTKQTNFFVSTLLTHVLTYHLGWVPTVSPYDVEPPSQGQPELRPYNALWAQLSDLCGSIGAPPKSARTIVVGAKNVQFVNKLLSVLTYFVRCGDIKRNDFLYKQCSFDEAKVVEVDEVNVRTTTNVDCGSNTLQVPTVVVSGSSNSTLVSSDVSLKKSTTFANLNTKLSTAEFGIGGSSGMSVNQFRRCPSMTMERSSDSSLSLSASDEELEKKVVFVLGDNEKLVGLKNKSNGGKSVKKSSKVQLEPINLDEKSDVCTKESECKSNSSQCCKQTLQHSKPIKHSGFKFEFDKYPQIVTNYMKSKNLEILDRHYIGKPGNLKLDNFQFDPTVVLPIQDERCEACAKCQTMEALLQTPTNASEMEYLNDMPRQVEPQYAKETVVEQTEQREMSPKTFVRKRKENTIIVNYKKSSPSAANGNGKTLQSPEQLKVKRVIEFPLPSLNAEEPCGGTKSGYDASLLGGVTNHYVPDLILQGTTASSSSWEAELRRDLDLTTYLNMSLGAPSSGVAIVGDTHTWEVRLLGAGGAGGGGLSPLVGSMLDALPAMRRARVPAQQCLVFVESRLREVCVLSRTLARLLMSTDLCDMRELTRALRVHVADVPLLLAVATTHTPRLAARYGLTYR